jgi:hypothetical protein
MDAGHDCLVAVTRSTARATTTVTVRVPPERHRSSFSTMPTTA